ncbi:MAG TPA: hypothetical protein VLA58_10755, partial [Chitinophagaceae bacterium]|nr:hypothetical protein [Chitinophagaceae bacterium]
MRISRIIVLTAFLAISLFATGQKKAKTTEQPAPPSYALNSSSFSALKLRNIGPAITSGRVADLAVNPKNPSEYYVAAASGGVWKTTNAGTTFTPIF